MLVFDTIVSLATPRMTAALAIVRMSGSKAIEILDKVLNVDAFKMEANHAYLRKLYKDGKNKKNMIDEALVTVFKAPNSYTGFDLVEFSLHGSMLIVDELIETLCKYGARVAKNGEFSYQAYYNNKLSLLQSEKINELIHAKSTLSKKLALQGISKNSHKYVEDIKNKLLDISASVEYIIEDEFIDDVQLEKEYNKIQDKYIKPLKVELEKLIDETYKASQIFNGIKIALIGEPNAGKSTLLNKILNFEKAIVTDIPGTTRDVVEGETYYKGIYFKIFDTAGIRETYDIIESMGIDRSKKMIEESNVVLLLSETDFKYFDTLNVNLDSKVVLKVLTKGDLKKEIKNVGQDITISMKDKNVDALFDLILDKMNLSNLDELSQHLTARELNYLININDKLKELEKLPKQTFYLNVLGDTVIQAIDIFNEMLGKSKGQTKEDVYNQIFKSFCMGK